MRGQELWQAKVAQLFHDPFLKAWCQGETAKAVAYDLAQTHIDGDEVPDVLWDRFACDKVAALLSVRLLGEDVVLPNRAVRWKHGHQLAEWLDAGLLPAELAPDFAASGADRPVLGTRHQVYVRLWQPKTKDHVVVTHPLADAPLRVPAPASEQALLEKLRPAGELLDQYRGFLPESGEERLRLAWYLAWRRLPEDLARSDGLFWPLQPADTRCPDHSIWDHLRVTSSLAFIPGTKTADENLKSSNPGRRPWLLSFWVGPARDFVGQARTGRDLWTGSMLLAELAWALIQPVAERFGADAVLYPDLRANLRADRWIESRFGEQVLGAPRRGSRASLIPNRLVALVPEDDLDETAEACLQSARERWRQMAEYVRDYLRNKAKGSGWRSIFDAQIERGPFLRWSAVRWEWDGYPRSAQADLEPGALHLNPAIPFQIDPPTLPTRIQEIEDKRAKRFDGWVHEGTWDHYQACRQTALMTHPGYLLGQRGFDYALAHHQLLQLDSARARVGWEPGRREPGEKCTLCGVRQALSDRGDGTVGQQRNAAREFWEPLSDEGDGAERLCGICAVRRFLSNTDDPIKDNWQGTVRQREGGARHEVPFPSTGLIARQVWLEEICKEFRSRVFATQQAVRAFVMVFRQTQLDRTQFADSLVRFRRLDRHGLDPVLAEFLKIDVQYLDAEKWDRLKQQGQVDKTTTTDAKKACRALQQCKGSSATHIAVISLDGDRMGRLLLGEPDAVKARWRDVLHPGACDQILAGDQPWKAFWRTTMERPRLLGPSTHAFITRALRHFANRILPWVVERGYGGRLIYAGGDDALIICPADQALPMLQKLHELFTAPWVLDRQPSALAWPGEEPEDSYYDVGSNEARDRFCSVPDNDARSVSGRIVPMLGPHQSFSAGVAFGHFKTSLRLLRSAALNGLDKAKRAGGRRAGLNWFTRNGVKMDCTAPLADAPGNIDNIRCAAQAFWNVQLPGRLPYKLREALPTGCAIVTRTDIDDDRRRELLKGIVARALDGAETHLDLVTDMWLAGLKCDQGPSNREASLDGLLLARALAGKER